jgi:uncharacterized small protein (TIGR04563 family)
VSGKKIVRNVSTPESREFWRSAEESAREVATWPDWKRAGINASQLRDTPRELPKVKGKQQRCGGRLSLYLPHELIAELRAEAERQERSLSWVVAAYWKRWKREQAK